MKRMKMTHAEYDRYVKRKMPKSKTGRNMLRAFISGGIICCIGQLILNGYKSAGLDQDAAAAATSITLIFLGALLTGLKIYDNMAKFAGAGTLIPITGFANSVVSPAMEFKSEGMILGMSAKMFVIAGPVIVFGTCASFLYGLIYALVT
ncbi:MAG TPA: stage V sporulation protein AC [Papillibacter sp.]|jgi:stage V sporulation protein AC|nr:stage V sporulation protein AC [Papillibacter sp.]